MASGPVRVPLRFGLVSPSPRSELRGALESLTAWMGERAGLDLERREAPTYEALAQSVRAGEVDAAWLPPIVFVRLGGEVEALGSVERGGARAYEAALVVRADANIRSVEALRGTRAGWVDPWSAAGFVLPRVKLALTGVDPRTLFRTERFHGSHRAAVQALVEGACDVIGTYARATPEGEVTVGAWSEADGAAVEVLATFGAIPPDVIGVRKVVPASSREAVLEAFRRAAEDERARALMTTVFGGTTLREGAASGYPALESALSVATARGLFD